jgi:hypothetical protein
MRTCVRMAWMGEHGNSTSGPERKRFEIALRSFSADRVLERAEQLTDFGLADALLVTQFLVVHKDDRAGRAQVRLFGRIVLDRRLGLDDADRVLMHVTDLPEPEAVAGLSRYLRF